MIITLSELKNKKLKVLVCAYACLGESGVDVEGGETVLGWNIVKQLSRFHKIFVITHSQNRFIIEETLKERPLKNINFFYLDLHPLNFLQKVLGGIQLYAYLWQIKAYFVARKLHKKYHFDVFHHVTYANDWMASFIGALLPIPYIRGPGGGAHRVPKKFLSELPFLNRIFQYLRSFGQWLFRHDPFFVLGQKRAKAILVCNRESLEAIPKRWRGKVYLFPVNGVSKEDLDLLSIAEKKDNNKFKILSVGKLLPIKGFSLAIKAFKIFSEKIPEAELTIVGDGSEASRLKKLVSQLKLEGKVNFLGWLPREKLLKKMTSFDVFLFLSLRDGGGQVVIEAMAAGLPVICLDIAGPGFHIKDQWGIKIPPHSPKQAMKETAKALEFLYYNKKLRLQLGKAAEERVEKFYHWDRLGEKLNEIYKKILYGS